MERDRRIVAGLDPPGSFEAARWRCRPARRRVLLTTKALLRDPDQPAVAGGHRVARHHRPQGGRAGAARRQGGGGAGEPQQDRVPRQYEPRAAHAAQRHHRLLAGHGRRGAGAAGQPALCRLCARHRSSGQHLLGIISDILDVSKLEAGRVEIEDDEIEIGQMARDVHASRRRTRPLARHRHRHRGAGGPAAARGRMR